jgi:hypothetical protein
VEYMLARVSDARLSKTLWLILKAGVEEVDA